MRHELKIHPNFYSAVASGQKKAEVRKNDRDFRAGDIVSLLEWLQISDRPTGRAVEVVITHVLPGGTYGLAADYCMFSFALINKN
jgi:Domain of unknown function (DUF3850)